LAADPPASPAWLEGGPERAGSRPSSAVDCYGGWNGGQVTIGMLEDWNDGTMGSWKMWQGFNGKFSFDMEVDNFTRKNNSF
jgi:hypothetical protein